MGRRSLRRRGRSRSRPRRLDCRYWRRRTDSRGLRRHLGCYVLGRLAALLLRRRPWSRDRRGGRLGRSTHRSAGRCGAQSAVLRRCHRSGLCGGRRRRSRCGGALLLLPLGGLGTILGVTLPSFAVLRCRGRAGLGRYNGSAWRGRGRTLLRVALRALTTLLSISVIAITILRRCHGSGLARGRDRRRGCGRTLLLFSLALVPLGPILGIALATITILRRYDRSGLAGGSHRRGRRAVPLITAVTILAVTILSIAITVLRRDGGRGLALILSAPLLAAALLELTLGFRRPCHGVVGAGPFTPAESGPYRRARGGGGV